MITEIIMHSLMSELASNRPIFHSEADFQHELAWLLHTTCGQNYDIRLEKPEMLNSDTIYVDIVLKNKKNNIKIFIELKYKTVQFSHILYNESFTLTSQGAHSNACYDFCKDISRIENLVQDNLLSMGFAIFLTNDLSYTRSPNAGADYSDFSIHQRKNLTGRLSWRSARLQDSDRSNDITLRGTYIVQWTDYSNLNNFGNSIFKYLLVLIT